MLHEHVQTHILSEVVAVGHRLVLLTHLTRVHLHLDLSLVCIVRMGDEETRHGEPLLHDVLGVFQWCLEQRFEVLIAWIIMVAGLLPLVDGVTLPDTDVEESVEKEDTVCLHLVVVEEHGLSLLVLQVITHECRLNHDE